MTRSYGDRVVVLAGQIDPTYLYRSLPQQRYSVDHGAAVSTLATSSQCVMKNRDYVAETVLNGAVYLHTVARVICTVAVRVARQRFPDRPDVMTEIANYYIDVLHAGNAIAAVREKHNERSSNHEVLMTARHLLAREDILYAAYTLDHLAQLGIRGSFKYASPDLPEYTVPGYMWVLANRIYPTLVARAANVTDPGDITDPKAPYADLDLAGV
ncbi:hypothetical protein FRC0549_00088 [Corynebacterium diphtheriae]|nr:hypothetical protein FRC0549_00088 [Corynebacterium diphtheriae]